MSLPLPSPRPLWAVMLADPLIDADGGPLAAEERVPWRLVPAALEEALQAAGDACHLELHLLTWQRAIEVVPRADVLVLLCAGLPGALAFEEERSGRLRPVAVRDDLPALFSGPGPRAALLLGPGTAEAAAALHRLGVPVALGLEEALPAAALQALCTTFTCALLAGRPVGTAARLARTGCGRGDAVRIFGEADAAPAPRPVEPLGEGAWSRVTPAEDLVGREGELAQLLGLLDRPGPVLLSGAAGIGKSELCRALLQRCRLGRWPAAGSALIDLRGIASTDDLLGALGSAGPGSRVAEAGRALAEAGRLVVLEHAEDLLWTADGRAALQALLATAQGGRARLVLASEEALPWPGAPLRLGPLRPAERGWALLRPPASSAEDPALAALAAALDGHPLALRLAAAQLGDGLPPARLLRALAEQGDLRRPGAASEGLAAALAPARDRLLRDRPRAAELWRLVAELPGGLPAEAALAAEEEADLGALHRENAVELQGGGYRCAGPLGAYALRHCPAPPPGRRVALREAALAGITAELRRVAPLLGTLRAKVALAALERWLPTLDRLLCDPEEALPAHGEALTAAAELALYAGLGPRVAGWCRAAEAWPEGARGPTLQALLAEVALGRGDTEAARQGALSALALATRGGQPATAARALLCLSLLVEGEGRREQAAARAVQARDLLHRAGDGPGEARSLLRLAALAAKERPEAARERFHAALALARTHGDGRTVCAAGRGLGELALRRGRPAEAGALFEEALREARAIACGAEEAAALLQLGQLALGERRAEPREPADGDAAERLLEARCRYDEALRRFRLLGDPVGEALALLGLGRLALLEGRPEDALAVGEHALGALGARPEPGARAEALLLLATATEALGARLLEGAAGPPLAQPFRPALAERAR